MKDTDVIEVRMEMTVLQARYLRRKLSEWRRGKLADYRRHHHPTHFEQAVMVIGLQTLIEAELERGNLPGA